ncbi:MAG: hypothetical protein IPK19_23635 [Chloroflexi bacterium]|nr:hypothetical protein [Chloroflexota bacterium]
MRILALLAFALLATIGLSIHQSNAAQVADVCPQFIADAVETVGNNCTGLSRNNACYGYDRVIASFTEAPSGEFFTRPRDIADLVNLTSIVTTPLRTELNEWGISLLSVQANLPDALPGQNVIFMLAGDVELENAVDAETAADPNGEFTPVQAFYFRTGIAQTDCREAPDTLIIQGPKNTQVDFNANGADVRIGSTIAMRTLPVDPEMAARIRAQYGFEDEFFEILELFVLDGTAILNPGTPNEQIIPQGYRGFRCLAPPKDLGLDGDEDDRQVFNACPWVDIGPATEQEIREFSGYEGIVLNYPIELPLGNETLTIASGPTNTPVPTNTLPAPTATTVPATSGPTAVPPTPTDTTVPNTPPTLNLDVPTFAVSRDTFVLTGSIDDPDDDYAMLTVNWGDGSPPEVFVFEEGLDLIAPAFSGPIAISIPHTYPQNGVYPLQATLQDASGNSVQAQFNAPVDPVDPIAVTKISGDEQSALPGQPFANPLVAQATDSGGAPVISWPLSITFINASLGCDPALCLRTDAEGRVSVNMVAGPEPGAAPVDIKVDFEAEGGAHYDLTVLSENEPPTVEITNVETDWLNGDIFTLQYTTADPNSDPLDITIHWDDSVNPHVFMDIPPGNIESQNEFKAAGTMFISVEVTDGEFTAEDTYTLHVTPMYPLSLDLIPQAGWTGETGTGQVYPGSLRVVVYDSEDDPVYGAQLYNLSGGLLATIPPSGVPITLGGPGGGYRDVQVTAACYGNEIVLIGSPDPSGNYYDEGLGFLFSTASIPVNQYSLYEFTNAFGDGQFTYESFDFEVPLGVELKSFAESPIEGATILFTIQDPANGAVFKANGATTIEAITNGSGTAFAGLITAGTAGDLYVNADYMYGDCVITYYFY